MKFGVIGYGKMGGAIANAASGKVFAPEDIFVYDVFAPALERAEANGFKAAEISEISERCDVVLLSVKPQELDGVLGRLNPKKGALVISIAAGVRISHIEEKLSESLKIIRVMPNLAASVGEGASCVCFNKNVGSEDKVIAEKILSASGEFYYVDESLMDEVVPYGGSFPAYFYYFLEKFIESAVNNGIDREVAEKMVIKSAEGSLKLAKTSGKSLENLISDVCSKGGTTIEGIKVFEDSDFAAVVDGACKACIKRSKELSGNL